MPDYRAYKDSTGSYYITESVGGIQQRPFPTKIPNEAQRVLSNSSISYDEKVSRIKEIKSIYLKRANYLLKEDTILTVILVILGLILVIIPWILTISVGRSAGVMGGLGTFVLAGPVIGIPGIIILVVRATHNSRAKIDNINTKMDDLDPTEKLAAEQLAYAYGCNKAIYEMKDNRQKQAEQTYEQNQQDALRRELDEKFKL